MPFDTCGGGPVYTQIDGFSEGGGRGGEVYFPQVNLLDEITSRGYGSNATYLLTFRNMDDWYRSITHWRGGPGDPLPPMSDRMARADINVSGTSLENFADFVCDHVTRVREAVPEGRLVEVDIDDADAGRMLSDVFDVDRGCWKQANANARLHRRRENDDGDDDDGDDDDGGDRNATTGSGSSGSSGSGGTEEKIGGRSTSSTTPPPLPTTTPSPRVVAAANEKVADTYPGKATIRGANGTMRANPTFVVGDRVGVGVGVGVGGERGWGGGGGKKAAAPKKEEAGGANKKKKKEESRRQEAMEVAEMMEAGEKSLI
jgi:hypothetical protein